MDDFEKLNADVLPEAEAVPEKSCPRAENAVGWRYAVFAAEYLLVAFGGALLLQRLAPMWVAENSVAASLLISLLSVDLIGSLLVWFLVRKLPRGNTGSLRMTVGDFFKGIPVCYCLVIAGAIVGTLVQTLVWGSADNAASSILLESGMFLRVLCIGIAAPVFEELIFRKFMIDHLMPRGKTFAIFLSAISFGLFHGNFSQAFFAFLLGLFFGYVYVKTGRLIYSIGYHMVVNLSTSVITMSLLASVDESDLMSIIPLGLWCVFLIGLGIAGLVILLVNRKMFTVEEEEGALKGKAARRAFFKSWGMIIFVVLCAVLFVISGLNMKDDGSEVLDFSAKYTVSVEGGEPDKDKAVVTFDVGESGYYVFTAGVDCGGDIPGFVTGIRLSSGGAGAIGAFTIGDWGYVELEPVYLEAGSYRFDIAFLCSEENALKFINKYVTPAGEEALESFEYEGFGRNGIFTVSIDLSGTILEGWE